MKRITLAAAVALLIVTASSALAAKIAVIGTGNVGSALGPEFAALGHTIVYGSRTPTEKDVQDLVAFLATLTGPVVQAGDAHAPRR